MAEVLIGLIGEEAEAVVLHAGSAGNSVQLSAAQQDSRGDRAEAAIKTDGSIGETEKQSLVKSRRGQGLFRERVAALEPHCRVTGVENPAYRIASHIKPWSRCSNEERLDGHNGLLLAPHIDHLFDNGFISFDDAGTLLISPVADVAALEQMGVPVEETMTVGSFTEKQRTYLAFHREEVFRKALIRTSS